MRFNVYQRPNPAYVLLSSTRGTTFFAIVKVLLQKVTSILVNIVRAAIERSQLTKEC